MKEEDFNKNRMQNTNLIDSAWERVFRPIAHIKTDFPTKFGIPRQAGIAKSLRAYLVFEKEYRNEDALRGLEGFSHLWLLWDFSLVNSVPKDRWDKNGRLGGKDRLLMGDETNGKDQLFNRFSPTVRPPRLGGNTRMGVFATRSPYRPNPIGLSCVELLSIKKDDKFGPVLVVGGADLMDNTPVFDIKPYLPYTDAHPNARGGWTENSVDYRLKVLIPDELLDSMEEEKRNALLEILAEDPRPSYQEDANRVYGFFFADYEIKFRVKDDTLFVCDIVKKPV